MDANEPAVSWPYYNNSLSGLASQNNWNTGGVSWTAQHSTFPDIEILPKGMFYTVFDQIHQEYAQIQNNMSSVVDSTVNGLEQGTIELTEVLSGRDLLEDYDPNTQRGQLHREAMAIGMDMPGDPGFQAKISHPDLAADSLWADLYLRLSSSSNLTVTGPMTIPQSDYEHALIGYTGQSSGNYQQQTLDSSSGDLEILELETTDQVVRQVDRTVGENGTVTLAPAESDTTPDPLANPDPKFDSWGLNIYAADGSNFSGTVGDAYVEDGHWKVDTNLSQGLSVDRINYVPNSEFVPTSVWTPDGGGYDVNVAEKIIERRRKINEKIEEEFNDGIVGGSPDIDIGIPTIPGLGVIESAVVVILAFVGLNAASG